MARFYGTIQGVGRGEVTKTGSRNNPLYATANGWECGAAVKLWVDGNDQDRIEIWLTGGSNAGGRPEKQVFSGYLAKPTGQIINADTGEEA